jgi:hypothetical protein
LCLTSRVVSHYSLPSQQHPPSTIIFCGMTSSSKTSSLSLSKSVDFRQRPHGCPPARYLRYCRISPSLTFGSMRSSDELERTSSSKTSSLSLSESVDFRQRPTRLSSSNIFTPRRSSFSKTTKLLVDLLDSESESNILSRRGRMVEESYLSQNVHLANLLVKSK